MNDTKSTTYTVYKHTSPSNKVYIGITSRPVKERWAKGHGYNYNTHFWRAIQKYGWDNFQHEILYENLSKEEASKLEIELIAKFDSMNQAKGYNLTTGGEHCTVSEEVRQRISRKLKGRKRSEVSLQNIRLGHDKLWNSGYSPVWVHKDDEEHIVSPEKAESFLKQGYEYGRSTKSYVYIHSGSVSKKVLDSNLQSYLDDGWELGRSKKDIESAAEASRRCFWTYENKKFKSANELASYLRLHGYPKIVSSTITSLYNKGFENSARYSSLQGKVERYENC